jgi:pimeloyl-ACP methyl ester carboxylesterase
MSGPRHLAPPHYETITSAGDSCPWLVLVHGASQHGGLFSAQVDAFRASHRLLVIDLPGHGRSSNLPGPYGLAEYARSAMAAIEDAGVDVAHYWGTHTGAGIGLMLALRHPERFASLVLDAAILPGVDLPYVTMAVGRARATARARGVDAARAEWFHQSRWFDVIRSRPDACRAKDHWEIIAAFSGRPWLDTSVAEPVEPLRDELSRIARPVLIINGERDVDDFLRVAEELETRLPNAQRVVVPGAGGFPLWECPAVVNPLVADFLSRIRTGSG